MLSRRLLTLSLVGVFAASSAVFPASSSASPLRPEPRSAPRIVNGVPATGDFGFLVALLGPRVLSTNDAYTAQFCGGALTTPTTVVTAAHCVVSDAGAVTTPGEIVIGFGTDLSAPMRLVKVTTVTPNPSYDTVTTQGDIAVLTLAEPVTDVTPLLPALSSPEPGTRITVAGWGNTSADDKQYYAELRQAELVVFPPASCGGGQGYSVDGVEFEGFRPGEADAASMLCAGGVRDGAIADTCQGDSGGPAISGQGAAARLVGVESWGVGCATHTPGVYTRVSAMTEFLLTSGALVPAAPPTVPPSFAVSPLNSSLLVSLTAPLEAGASLTATATLPTGEVFSCAAPAGFPSCVISSLANGVEYSVTATASTSVGSSPASAPQVSSPAPVPDPGAVVRYERAGPRAVWLRVSEPSANGSPILSWRASCVSSSGAVRAAKVVPARTGGWAKVKKMPRGAWLCAATATSAAGPGYSLPLAVNVS